MEITNKILINCGFLILAIILGIVLHKTGKPYHAGIFAIHKLATLAFIIFTITLIVQISKTGQINVLLFVLIFLAVIALLTIMISGALLSLGKLEMIMLKMHKIASTSLLIAIALVFYRILSI